MSYKHNEEHGVTYVLGEERRRCTVWNGCHHQHNAVMVNRMRFENDWSPGRYLAVRRVTRPYQDGQTQEFRDDWHSKAILPPQGNAPQPLRGNDPCNGGHIYAWPRCHHKARLLELAALEDWTMNGTAEGDAWIEQYYADAWKLHLDAAGLVETERLLRPKPVTPPML